MPKRNSGDELKRLVKKHPEASSSRKSWWKEKIKARNNRKDRKRGLKRARKG